MSRSIIRQSVLPTDLLKARFSTIARDSRFSPFFTGQETSKAIFDTLKRIYEAPNRHLMKRRIRGEAAFRRRQLREEEEALRRIEEERQRKIDVITARVQRRQRAQRREMRTRLLNMYRDFNRTNVHTYTIGSFEDRAFGPQPERWLLTLFKRHAGKRIRILALNGIGREEVRGVHSLYGGNGYVILNEETKRGSIVRRFVYNEEQGVSEIMTGDQTYTVPHGNTQINRYFKGRGSDTNKAIDWLFVYPIVPSSDPLLHPGDTIKVYEASNVEAQPTPTNQHFAQGVSHCVIQPIVTALTEKRDSLKAPSKQTLSNYNCSLATLNQYAEDYAMGIPVPAIHSMVEDVSKCGTHITIDIKSPCAKKGEDQFLRFENQYSNTGRLFEFVNWRFDHVDALEATYKDVNNAREVTRDQIQNIIRDLTKQDQFCEWSCDSQGPVCVCTATDTYRCNVSFGEAYTQFTENFNGFRVDHIGDSLMSNFILEGTHWCCSAAFNKASTHDLKCYDISKSYAKFYEARFYEECKFPSKFTDLRPIDKVMGPGMYRIQNLDWSEAGPKFRDICTRMGNPFREGNVYVYPLLKLLDFHNVKYDITMGLWAGGRENTFDFRFDEELIKSKDYAKIVGRWAHLRHEDITCIKGTREFASHLKSTSKNCDAFWFPRTDIDPWSSSEGTIQIRYPRKHVWHLSQFSAYINAYEFIKMTDQLMLVDLDKVIQIQKDDFICEAHDFFLLPYMREKTDELFTKNDYGVTKLARKLEWNVEEERTYDTHGPYQCCYLSGVDEEDDNPIFKKIEENFTIHSERYSHIDTDSILPHPIISLEGPGGTGKTDYLLWGMKLGLLQRCVYIAQSHKLGRAKADEYTLIMTGDSELDEMEKAFKAKKTLTHREEKTLQITVWARTLHENPETWGLIHRYANVLIFDEVSMMHCETCKFLIDRFSQHKVYFCGDPGFQLAAYKTNRDGGEERTPYNSKTIGIPSYTFSKIFRVKDERLLAIRSQGRYMLQTATKQALEVFYKSNFTVVKTMEEVAQMYEAWTEENGKYLQKDMIICSTNEFADEWTSYLKPLQKAKTITRQVTYSQGSLHAYYKAATLSDRHELNRKHNLSFAKCLVTDKSEAHKQFKHYDDHLKKMSQERVVTKSEEVVLQKWKMTTTSRDYSNGQIVISEKPPMEGKCILTHAFTAHSTIGETARGRVFIDRRNMFEIEHWETIVGRAKRWEDIIIVDLPDPDPKDKYKDTKIYCISSKRGDCTYIGHTTLPTIEERLKQHLADYKSKNKKTCMSRIVLKNRDWKIDLIEEYPCASKYQALAREQYHINQYKNCVNKLMSVDKTLPSCVPTKSNIEKHNSPCPYMEHRVEYIDGYNLKSLVDEVNKYEIDAPTKPRKSMSKEEREIDNIRLFKKYVVELNKKVEVNENGDSYISVTYTRKSCGGRRYSIGDFSDEMGTAKKISYSLQGMYGILRRFLIGRWCHDIDIVNCIPTILIQIAEEDGVPLQFRETLGYYIMNRQDCLDEIMDHHGCSKEDAKEAVIRIYNGGSFKKWALDCCITMNKMEPAPFLEDLKAEIDEMKKHMLSLPKYESIRTACMKLDSNKRIDKDASDRSAFATICFKREDEILQAIEESVVNDGWRTETLIYDGIPLYDRGLPLEPSMRRAEEHVLHKTGISIQLAEKPMYQENLKVDDVIQAIRKK